MCKNLYLHQLLHRNITFIFIALLIALYKGLDVIFFRGSDNYSGSGSNLNNTWKLSCVKTAL